MRVFCLRQRHGLGGAQAPSVSYAAYVRWDDLPPEIQGLRQPRVLKQPGGSVARVVLPLYVWAPARMLEAGPAAAGAQEAIYATALIASLRWEAAMLQMAFPEAPAFGAPLFATADLRTAGQWIDEPEPEAVARRSARRRWSDQLLMLESAKRPVGEDDLFG